MKIQALAAVIVLVLAGVSARAQTMRSADEMYEQILQQSVQNGLVDYTEIGNKHAQSLRGYLLAMAEIDPARLPEKDRLAHDINLYNATMIQAVLDHLAKDPDWTPAADDFAVFKEPRVHIGDMRVTLNELENDIIRKQFQDPRIHAALNCAAVSCPPLLPRAYRAEDLDQVLDENMRRFINDPARNTIDHANRKLVLSQIFEWYADDFGGRDRLADYLNTYIDRDVSGYDVSFQPYDWSLNAADAGDD